MKFTILKETESPFLSRKRISFEVDYAGSRTPSKEEIKKSIASSQKVKEELIAVRHIYPKFGKSEAKLIIHVYKTIEDLKKYEPKSKKKNAKEESNSAEKPKEEVKKTEEKPKEEKKEEVKEEKKTEEKPKEETVKDEANGKEESKEQKTE